LSALELPHLLHLASQQSLVDSTQNTQFLLLSITMRDFKTRMNQSPIVLFVVFSSLSKVFHFHTLTFLTFAKLKSGLAKYASNLTPSLQVARTFFNKLTAAQRFLEQLNRNV
jgi:hypothetical protein